MSDTPQKRSWLMPILAPLWFRFKELLVFSLFINLLALAAPVFILQVYDRVIFHAGLSTLQGLVLGMAAVIVFDFILRQARSRLMQRVAMKIDVDLGRRVFEKINALPLRLLESRPAGFWQSAYRDADTVRNTIGGPTAVLMIDLPFVVLFIGLIYVIAAPIVWVLVVALVAFAAVAGLSSWMVQRRARRERDSMQQRDLRIAELITGRSTVKALAVDDWTRPVWEDAHADTVAAGLHRGANVDGFGNLAMGLSILTTVALTSVGALAILDQQMTIGALIAANMLSTRIISPLNQLVGAWRGLAAYRQATGRLAALFAEAEDLQETTVSLRHPEGVLSLEDVTFAFDPAARPTLDAIRFTIKPGGMHAIVGPNGSGKSTLIKLMQGLYQPDDGRLLIDGADLRQFSRADLARWIGYVPQETWLFAGSVRDNIAMRAPEASDDQVMEAARLAGVHDLIIDLPDGYATDIGEAGQKLSAGVRQRIAIARALINGPSVLLLDEPTSSLDRDAETHLRDMLKAYAREHNVVVVTHSETLLRAADNVIAMDGGRIQAAGSARDILPKLFGGTVTPIRPEQSA